MRLKPTIRSPAPRIVGRISSRRSCDVIACLPFNTTMTSEHRRPHALVIPHSPQGHWIPTKPLLWQMVKLGVSFTVVSSSSRISELERLKLRGELGDVDVELIVGFHDVPEGLRSSTSYVDELRRQFYEESQALQNVKNSSSEPTFLLADMFLHWTQDVAEELGIPRYTYFTSPCSFALMTLYTPTIFAEGWYPSNPDRSKLDETVNVPGLQLFRAKDMPKVLYENRHFYDSFRKSSLKADGILVNSLDPCEGKEADILRAQLPSITDGKVPKVFLIGPVALLPTFSSKQSADASTQRKEESECLQYLDSQSAASVIYICFGSQFQPPLSALTELARGLELSEVPFLWILPVRESIPLSTEFLPAGFESRTKGRGLVWTGWAPQKDILDHPSVGGFMSHCGWNSFQEAVIAGVPIITWPLLAEQCMNARAIVRVWKVGVAIKEDTDNYSKEDITKAIRMLMVSDVGKDVRLEMQNLKSAALAAVAEGGSSDSDLRKFFHEATKHITPLELDRLTISS